MTTYKELKSVSHLKQNIRFTENLLNTSFHTYGKNKFSTYCPFHDDKEDSFRVYVNDKDEVRFHCFGSCSADWDVYDIIMHKKKCSFREAQHDFARYVGEEEFQAYSNQQIPDIDTLDVGKQVETPRTDAEIELEPELSAVLNDAADFYNGLLLDQQEQFSNISNYLKKRGVGQELIKDFRIGFSPAYKDDQFEGRALIKKHLKLFQNNYLEFYPYNKSGLVRLLSDDSSRATQSYRRFVDNTDSMGIYGGYGDFFAGRITFPVYDIKGCIQGLVGRRPDNRGKRWIKQQAGDSGIRPGGWLYGIDKAVAAIRRYKTVILVEGIFDYFVFYKLFQNKDMACVVSTLGTKLTDESRIILQTLGVQNFIVAYDWDDAGRYAIKKAAGEIGATVYYLGGMAEKDDPAISLKNTVPVISSFSLSHLMSAAKNIQDKTEKPVFISHITTGSRTDREIIMKPDTCLGNEVIPKQTQKVKEYFYDADQFLPLLTYDHGNKAALDKKIEMLIDMLESRPTETAADISFKIPVNFVEDANYSDLGPALIFWFRTAIEQQHRKRKIRESDNTLAGWLKTSRATIIKYKKMLLEAGYLNIDTSRKIQRLSVRYFPK